MTKPFMTSYSTSRHASCDLDWHRSGRRVSFRVIDRKAGEWVLLVGTVTSHRMNANGGLVSVACDDGIARTVSCSTVSRAL